VKNSLFVTLLICAAAANAYARSEDTPDKTTAVEAAASSGVVVIDRVVASVSGDVVTMHDVNKRIAISANPLSSVLAGGSGEDDGSARFKAALDDLISDKLILSEARKLSLSVSEKDVDDYVNGITKQNNWSADDFKLAVKMLGFKDVPEYRAHASNELLKSRVLRVKVGSRVTVSDRDVQEVFDARFEGGTTEEEIHLHHIALLIPENVTEDGIKSILKSALEVRALAVAGETPFDELAAEYGQDASASGGGDVGWFPRGRLQASLEDAAFALRDGEISGVVQSAAGFHVLKVSERRRIPLADAEEARRRVKWELSEASFQNGYKDFVRELRAAARIEILYTPPAR
jgi:peptidyl-prolyl cis-trans isomerase SurA